MENHPLSPPTFKTMSGDVITEISRRLHQVRMLIDTRGYPEVTVVTAWFNILEHSDWSESKKVTGNETEFLIQQSAFGNDDVKEALVKYKIRDEASAEFRINIVD